MAEITKEKRKEMVIEALNKARAMELYAIHQYMNQHYNLDNWDYGDMAAKIKLIAIDEMRHAEAITWDQQVYLSWDATSPVVVTR